MTSLTWRQQSIEYPATQEPEWSSKVERWYQLDTPAYVLTETFWRVRHELTERPEWLLLASLGASNLTDSQFASSASPSPAKFVHTLPNIRSASLLQVMQWSGKVLCLQKDPATLVTALEEGLALAREDKSPVWIAVVSGAGRQFTGHLLTLGGNSSEKGSLKIVKNAPGTGETGPARDRDLLLWFSESSVHRPEFQAGEISLFRDR